MDVRDIRIGDIVGIKTLNNGKTFCFIQEIKCDGDVYIVSEDEDPFDCHVTTLLGIKAESHHFGNMGAWYDDKKVEHIFTFRGGLRIAIRPQVGAENFIASRIGEYKPKYCRFTYIHELQHWLWDMYKIVI